LFSLSLSDAVIVPCKTSRTCWCRVLTRYWALKTWYFHVPSWSWSSITHSISYPFKLFLTSDDLFVLLPLTLDFWTLLVW